MIKPNTLVAAFEFISEHDEAVDRPESPQDPTDKAAAKAHEEALADFKHRWKLYRDGMGEPPLKPGITPTRFKLRHVSSSERVYLLELEQSDDKALMITAAAMSLVGAVGLLDENGKKVEIQQEVTNVGPLQIRHATKAALDLLPLLVILELGGVAMERSVVRPSS